MVEKLQAEQEEKDELTKELEATRATLTLARAAAKQAEDSHSAMVEKLQAEQEEKDELTKELEATRATLTLAHAAAKQEPKTPWHGSPASNLDDDDEDDHGRAPGHEAEA